MDEKFHRLFDRIWYGFLDTAEMVLVKWGWIIFPLGLPGVWIPFFGHTVLNIIVMVLAIMLVYLFSRRFIQHAVAEYHKKSYGRMIMFLVLALPFFSILVVAQVLEGMHWHTPISWGQWLETTTCIVMFLMTAALRWWYLSGAAMQSGSHNTNTSPVTN